MTDKAIAIYCFLDDFCKASVPKEDAHCKLNDAEITTTALLVTLFFYGNQASAMKYMHEHHGLKMIDKLGFSRRIHRLEARLAALLHTLDFTLKNFNISSLYIIERSGVPVIPRSRLP